MGFAHQHWVVSSTARVTPKSQWDTGDDVRMGSEGSGKVSGVAGAGRSGSGWEAKNMLPAVQVSFAF